MQLKLPDFASGCKPQRIPEAERACGLRASSSSPDHFDSGQGPHGDSSQTLDRLFKLEQVRSLLAPHAPSPRGFMLATLD